MGPIVDFDFTQPDTSAPGAGSFLGFEPTGNRSGTLKFMNPATDADGSELTGLTSINVAYGPQPFPPEAVDEQSIRSLPGVNVVSKPLTDSDAGLETDIDLDGLSARKYFGKVWWDDAQPG